MDELKEALRIPLEELYYSSRENPAKVLVVNVPPMDECKCSLILEFYYLSMPGSTLEGSLYLKGELIQSFNNKFVTPDKKYKIINIHFGYLNGNVSITINMYRPGKWEIMLPKAILKAIRLSNEVSAKRRLQRIRIAEANFSPIGICE